MRRGLFIFMAWICVVGIQAQSDFSFILNKEGKIIVLPKNKTYELNIPKASYKTFTPAGTRDIDIKLREFTPDIPHTSLQERPMDMQILPPPISRSLTYIPRCFGRYRQWRWISMRLI